MDALHRVEPGAPSVNKFSFNGDIESKLHTMVIIPMSGSWLGISWGDDDDMFLIFQQVNLAVHVVLITGRIENFKEWIFLISFYCFLKSFCKYVDMIFL